MKTTPREVDPRSFALILIILCLIVMFISSCGDPSGPYYRYRVELAECNSNKVTVIVYEDHETTPYIYTDRQAMPVFVSNRYDPQPLRKVNICDFKVLSKTVIK